MVLQTRMNPVPPDPVQAKVMQFMPYVFSVFFFFFPAGLVLYWVVNNLLSITQHVRLKTSRHPQVATPCMADFNVFQLREQFAEQIAAQFDFVTAEVKILTQAPAELKFVTAVDFGQILYFDQMLVVHSLPLSYPCEGCE